MNYFTILKNTRGEANAPPWKNPCLGCISLYILCLLLTVLLIIACTIILLILHYCPLGSQTSDSGGSSGAVIGGVVGGVVVIVVIIILVILVLIYMRTLHQKKSNPAMPRMHNTISDSECIISKFLQQYRKYGKGEGVYSIACMYTSQKCSVIYCIVSSSSEWLILCSNRLINGWSKQVK